MYKFNYFFLKKYLINHFKNLCLKFHSYYHFLGKLHSFYILQHLFHLLPNLWHLWTIIHAINSYLKLYLKPINSKLLKILIRYSSLVHLLFVFSFLPNHNEWLHLQGYLVLFNRILYNWFKVTLVYSQVFCQKLT